MGKKKGFWEDMRETINKKTASMGLLTPGNADQYQPPKKKKKRPSAPEKPTKSLGDQLNESFGRAAKKRRSQ